MFENFDLLCWFRIESNIKVTVRFNSKFRIFAQHYTNIIVSFFLTLGPQVAVFQKQRRHSEIVVVMVWRPQVSEDGKCSKAVVDLIRNILLNQKCTAQVKVSRLYLAFLPCDATAQWLASLFDLAFC